MMLLKRAKLVRAIIATGSGAAIAFFFWLLILISIDTLGGKEVASTLASLLPLQVGLTILLFAAMARAKLQCSYEDGIFEKSYEVWGLKKKSTQSTENVWLVERSQHIGSSESVGGVSRSRLLVGRNGSEEVVLLNSFETWMFDVRQWPS